MSCFILYVIQRRLLGVFFLAGSEFELIFCCAFWAGSKLGFASSDFFEPIAGVIFVPLLTEADRAAFATYCDAYSKWKDATEFINQHGQIFKTPSRYIQQVSQVSIAQTYGKLMTKIVTEFELTPASRSRIIAGGTGGEILDEMDELLDG